MKYTHIGSVLSLVGVLVGGTSMAIAHSEDGDSKNEKEKYQETCVAGDPGCHKPVSKSAATY